jgi:hypothetical protein
MRGKQTLFKLILALDRMRLHVLPKHYYTPVPDCTWLDKNRNSWMGRSSLKGIDWGLLDQFEWLKSTCESNYQEVAGLGFYSSLAQGGLGPGFGPIESQVLHCFIRTHAPAKIVEIGSGVSTICMLEAAALNQREGTRVPKITCVEPYPSENLRKNKKIELIPKKCQEVPLSLFENLSSGDLLFIDSSHAVKVGSDVVRIYLEIIPNLPPGVTIHIHEVYLPYAYPRDVFSMPYWWQETALLTALLVNNSKLSVLSCLSAQHYDNSDRLQELLTDYRPAMNNEGLASGPTSRHFPSSLWLQTK